MRTARPRHPVARLIRLVAILFLPLGLVAGAVLITLPQRMNDLALGSAEERARGLAQVMASLVEPDLEFEDHEHAREALARLAVEPDLLGAELYGRDSKLFASWQSPEESAGAAPAAPPGPEALLTTKVEIDDRGIEASAPVKAPGGTSGILRLRFATRGIEAKQRANTITAGLAAAVVVLVGLVFSILVARFLTRRQAAEEALRRSSASFAALSDSLPVALVLHRAGRVLYVNPAGIKLLGAEPEQTLVGDELAAYLAPGETLPATSGETRVHLDPRTLELASGKVLSVEAASLQVQYGEEDAAALVAFDVTERTRMQERLLLTDRMASLGTLAAGVAHEINNPLSVVIGNLEFVRESMQSTNGLAGGGDPLLASELVAALAEALDGAERVGRIVKDMKTLSRSDGDSLGPTDINVAIEKSLQMVQSHLKHRARLISNLGPVPKVIGNESRLVQVFVNLLINAAQALPEGKTAENCVEVITALWPGGTVVATVRDTGAGIPRAVLDRIFDPFFTTKPVGVGTGLGLSIVHTLVRAMDGRIEVDSSEGEGTTFSISMRVAPEVERLASDAAELPASARGRILIIDDEPAVLSALERLLSGHELTRVESARVALERFARGESFDLIMCDLRMPDMSGIELAARMDERHPDLRRRLVFMTGDISEAGMSHPGLAPLDPASIAPVLEKPFSRRALLQFVGRYLQQPGSSERPAA
jgi:two-component system cell cycle sensor histidine kinase/response regulator CckA